MFNLIILTGRVGNIDEVRTVNGSNVVSISLATTKRWRVKDTNERAEKTQWHKVTLWAGLADIVTKYARKGSKLQVTGELEYEQWEKEGVKMKTANIHAHQLILLDSKTDSPEQTVEEPASSDDLPF